VGGAAALVRRRAAGLYVSIVHMPSRGVARRATALTTIAARNL
jgi:hypothetical protein